VHKLDYSKVYEHFLDSEYDVEPLELMGCDFLRVHLQIENDVVSLLHCCVAEITSLPHFYLENHEKYGRLAHVLPVDIPIMSGLGAVCVNNLDSVSVNYECPELAFEESIRRHKNLLTQLLTDNEFNKSELLREFSTNWQAAWIDGQKKQVESLVCVSGSDEFDILKIYRPVSKSVVNPLGRAFVALPEILIDSNISGYLLVQHRSDASEAITTFNISIHKIGLDFPRDEAELKTWVADCLSIVGGNARVGIDKFIKTRRSKEFWGVFKVDTPSGKSYFGVRFICKSKKSFPDTLEELSSWRLEPISLNILNKNEILPRSGGEISLAEKKVLLIGCGSVGSEVADKLGASGIGEITISDPDHYSSSNIYRHLLDSEYLFSPKSSSVCGKLAIKYPWIIVKPSLSSILDLRKKELIRGFDLVVIAIGSPTQERIFQEFISKSNLNLPVIYTWLEGYGIGGHAVLDVPNSKGCLKCAYVDAGNERRGLASNLNFLEPDQDIVKNFAGCGEMFIPYGHLSSSQTALITVDLALKYLRGVQHESAKVSWKGSCDDAVVQGLKLSRRYKKFSKNLEIQSLYHPMCDICSDSELFVFEKQGVKVRIPKTIIEELNSYKQVDVHAVESAGLLIGYNRGDVYTINRITCPQEKDTQKRSYFKLDHASHQKVVDECHASSDGILGYIGTWHTHPQSVPSPSTIDLKDWMSHKTENYDRQLFFLILGVNELKVFSIVDGVSIELIRLGDF